jgi:hypothetical protein
MALKDAVAGFFGNPTDLQAGAGVWVRSQTFPGWWRGEWVRPGVPTPPPTPPTPFVAPQVIITPPGVWVQGVRENNFPLGYHSRVSLEKELSPVILCYKLFLALRSAWS